MSNPFADSAVPADWCIHAANLCYLASYLGRDMLWLRVLTCCGLTLGIVFFTCGSVPMFGPTAWQAAFLGINLVQIARLLKHRERVRLSQERAELAGRVFEHLSREELADLLTRSVRVGTRAPAAGGLDPSQLTDGELTEDEVVLRDVAFGGLSRSDLLNLVTRRFHGTLYRLTPSRVRAWTKRRVRRKRKRAVKKALRAARPKIAERNPRRGPDRAAAKARPTEAQTSQRARAK